MKPYLTRLEELKEKMNAIVDSPKDWVDRRDVVEIAKGIRLLIEEINYRQYKGY